MKISNILHKVPSLARPSNPYFGSSALKEKKLDVFSTRPLNKRYILHALTYPYQQGSPFLTKDESGTAYGMGLLKTCLNRGVIHPMMTLGELLGDEFDSQYKTREAYNRSLLCEAACVGSVKSFIQLWAECIGNNIDVMEPGKDGLNPFQTIILQLISARYKSTFCIDFNKEKQINIDGCYEILKMLLEAYGTELKDKCFGTLETDAWRPFSHKPTSSVLKAYGFRLPEIKESECVTSSKKTHRNGLKLVTPEDS